MTPDQALEAALDRALDRAQVPERLETLCTLLVYSGARGAAPVQDVADVLGVDPSGPSRRLACAGLPSARRWGQLGAVVVLACRYRESENGAEASRGIRSDEFGASGTLHNALGVRWTELQGASEEIWRWVVDRWCERWVEGAR